MQTPTSGSNSLVAMFRLSQGHLGKRSLACQIFLSAQSEGEEFFSTAEALVPQSPYNHHSKFDVFFLGLLTMLQSQ